MYHCNEYNSLEWVILTINQAVLYFFIYSFFGWIYETALVSIREKQWSNRGFLMGPVCPIYGAGAAGNRNDMYDERYSNQISDNLRKERCIKDL